MKKIILFSLFLISSTLSFSQDTTSKAEYFVVLYTTGTSWDNTKDFHEQKYFQEHSSHLAKLRKTKQITIGGRYSDKGMMILKAKNESEAKSIIEEDVSVKNKLFNVEIFLFDAFYPGCIE